KLSAGTKQWIEQQAETKRAYGLYLERWGDWPNPWETAQEAGAAGG
ncbi:MAG: 3'-5' exonuclease, partial [Planctomycetes bacterium]|nr:3'-5' exonuclease [Planctomycetota bacterium]